MTVSHDDLNRSRQGTRPMESPLTIIPIEAAKTPSPSPTPPPGG